MARTEIYKKYRFRVVIAGVASALFQKCSGVKVTAGEAEYWEGGSMTAEKSPSRLKFDDITLERGVSGDPDLYNWFMQVGLAAAGPGGIGVGVPEPAYKKNPIIQQMDRAGNVVMAWQLTDAWPKTFEGGEWDNTTDEVNLERVVLAIKFAERIQ